MDYIYPEFVTKILKTPSERTQMESSLVGISIMMLGSLSIVSYMLFTMDLSLLMKIFISLSELGILAFQFGLLSQTYQVYHQYKLANGLYPKDYKLQLLINNAKSIKEELEYTISSVEREEQNVEVTNT